MVFAFFAGIGVLLLLLCIVLVGKRIEAVRRVAGGIGSFLAATNPMNKLKICMGFYMVVSKLGSVYQLSLPPAVNSLMASVSAALVLGLDVSLIPLGI